MSIRKKVTAALLLPVIALIFYSFTSSYRYYGVYSGMKQVKSMVGVSSSISRLVHELQKERGMTSGYVASNRTKFASELPAQREAVDTTEKQLKEYIGENSLPDDLKSRLKSTLAELEMRTDIRRKADTGGITAAESAAFYSGINEKLLSEVFKASAQTDNAAISRALAAYANFLTAKETAGIERAFLTSVLSEGRFTTDSYGRFSALSSRQSAYLTMFENTASAAVQAIFSQSVDNADYKNAIEMKQTLAGKADAESIGIDSEEWFKAATARINVLKAAEDRIAQSIDADASALLDSAFYSLCLNAAVAAGSMAALVALLYIIHTSIVGNITRLTKLTAELNSADADLTHRLNIKTGDELQELAENVNSFIAGISEIVAEVKHTASSLASSSSELAATADQLSGTLATQSGQVSDIASAMEEMNVTSRSIYNHIEEAQKLAEDAHSSTNTGSVRLRVAVDMVNGIRQSTDKLS
jgi:methyl-accepting chemotaxis protein